MKAFIVWIASFVALLVVVSAGEGDDTEMSCIPNENYMMDCNHCFCDSTGLIGACTYKGCAKSNCTEGTISRNESGDFCICRKGMLFCFPRTFNKKRG